VSKIYIILIVKGVKGITLLYSMDDNENDDNDDNDDEDTIEYNYNYGAVDKLAYAVDNLYTFKRAFICAYDVNTSGQYPFLRFLLHKYEYDVERIVVDLPCIDIANENAGETTNTSTDFEELLTHAQKYITRIMPSEPHHANGVVMYKGCIVKNPGDVYLFFDVTRPESVEESCMYLDDSCEVKSYFCIIDEIINTRKVFDIDIGEYVYDLFAMNRDLLFLTDDNEDKYEIPVSCYTGSENHMLHFVYVFGVSRMTTDDAILGPYYYFTDYENCKRTMCDGIVRFAVFLGNTLVKLNLPNDAIDDSITKRERLNMKELHSYEVMTMRITDYDGAWSREYDSVYLGCIELDDGRFFKNCPWIVVERYNQQISLSYHKTPSTPLHI